MSVINDFLPVPAAAVPQSADDRVSGSRSGGKAELERRRGWRCGTAGGRNLGGVQGSHRGLEPVTRPSTEPFGPSTNYSSYSLNAWRHLVVGAVYMCVRCDNISLGRTNRNEEPENVKLTSTGAGWDGFGIARRRVTLTLTPHFSCPAPPNEAERKPGTGARRIFTVITVADGVSHVPFTRAARSHNQDNYESVKCRRLLQIVIRLVPSVPLHRAHTHTHTHAGVSECGTA